MMLAITDVCLMLNCFLFEKVYLRYALRDFDSILLHCTKLFIRQSIDRQQIFDVTFEPPIEKSCVRHCTLGYMNDIMRTMNMPSVRDNNNAVSCRLQYCNHVM